MIVVSLLDALLAVLRPVFFWAAVALAVVFAVDWLVRTRRISPFNPVARFFRRTVDPLMLPVERRIVRAGGTPAHAPWWALALVVVGGIIPAADEGPLKEAGVARVYTPKDFEITRIMGDIVDLVAERAGAGAAV